MKKNCYLFLLLAFGMAFGQDETTNWYFGRGAGLQFNADGTVISLTDGKISTEEGCASISDDKGSLLFYTDGITVYDRNHQIMENGNRLYGDPSSTQSAIIVPKPADDDIFFIFTVDTSIRENDPDFGFNYSIVDISKNDGNGAVIEKNINLLASCSEKIAAVVKDCSDESVWVMTLSTFDGTDGLTDTFHAFEVSDEGVETNSIKSKFDVRFGDQRGYLKFSSDGQKMASANEFDGLYLYDFDAETGMVSNSKPITISAPYKNPYSVEFSPNNRFLYVHSHSDTPALETGHNSNLLQFDLSSSDISSSEVILDERGIYRGALQLGSNGKIYRTITETYLKGSQYLGVIDNPNQKGKASDYRHNAIFLESGTAMQGLPPFVQSFFAKEGLIKSADGSTITAATLCFASEVVLEAENLPGAIYEWEHNGELINNPNGHVLRINSLSEDDAGQYRLRIDPADPTKCNIVGEAQIQVIAPPEARNYRLVQCDVDEGSESASSDGFTVFNLKRAKPELSPVDENEVSFYESLEDLANDHPIDNPDSYINTVAERQILLVKVTDPNGCSNESEMTLEINPSEANLVTGEAYYACDLDPTDDIIEGNFDLVAIREENYSGLDAVFYASRNDAALQINAIAEDHITSITKNIFVRIESFGECLGVEELQLVVNPTPLINLETEFLVCTNNPKLQIMAEEGFDTYVWRKKNNGIEVLSQEQTVEISEPGDYELEVGWLYTDAGINCSNIANFTVYPSNNATITDIEIADLQENNQVVITAVGDGDYEYAVGDENGPYQDSPNLENVEPGLTKVYVRDKNGCGITEEEVSVIGFPKFFTPNGDGINESWNLIGISEEREIDVSIFDRYGKLVYRMNSRDGYGWNGTFNGESLPASDYWFKINLEKGRIYKGHFSLKR